MTAQDLLVVTGAGSGIGLAVTTHALACGRAVLALDQDTTALDGLDHPSLRVHALDVRDADAVNAAVDAVPQHLTICGLVTCAAVFKRVPFLELTPELFDTTFAVNLTGTLIAAKAVLPRLRAQRCGSIVMLSSSLARIGSPTGAHYAATKGGVLGLARSLALEVADEGIRVNVVSPGLTDTPQPRAHPGGAEAMAERAKTIPLGRIGHVDDVVAAIDFLLAAESSYVTGQDIRVNGGSQIS